jgi:hypothetical protein
LREAIDKNVEIEVISVKMALRQFFIATKKHKQTTRSLIIRTKQLLNHFDNENSRDIVNGEILETVKEWLNETFVVPEK